MFKKFFLYILYFNKSSNSLIFYTAFLTLAIMTTSLNVIKKTFDIYTNSKKKYSEKIEEEENKLYEILLKFSEEIKNIEEKEEKEENKKKITEIANNALIAFSSHVQNLLGIIINYNLKKDTDKDIKFKFKNRFNKTIFYINKYLETFQIDILNIVVNQIKKSKQKIESKYNFLFFKKKINFYLEKIPNHEKLFILDNLKINFNQNININSFLKENENFPEETKKTFNLFKENKTSPLDIKEHLSFILDKKPFIKNCYDQILMLVNENEKITIKEEKSFLENENDLFYFIKYYKTFLKDLKKKNIDNQQSILDLSEVLFFLISDESIKKKINIKITLYFNKKNKNFKKIYQYLYNMDILYLFYISNILLDNIKKKKDYRHDLNVENPFLIKDILEDNVKEKYKMINFYFDIKIKFYSIFLFRFFDISNAKNKIDLTLFSIFYIIFSKNKNNNFFPILIFRILMESEIFSYILSKNKFSIKLNTTTISNTLDVISGPFSNLILYFALYGQYFGI